jgi:hypothetical protein
MYVIHHFKATEFSCFEIAIGLVSSFKFLLRELHKSVRAIRDCKKETSEIKRRAKKEEIISRNCIAHHRIDNIFINTQKAARLYFLPM